MQNYLNWTVQELFEQAASPAPEPGGGGVSAITGFLGCSMLTMVARITWDNPKYKDVAPAITAMFPILEESMSQLKSLAQQDVEAYNAFMAVLALPKDTPEQKCAREGQKLQAALLSAGVPMDIARNCLTALRVASELADIGSKPAISDIGVGAHLLESALKGALLMVEANLIYITDKVKVQALATEKEKLALEAEELVRLALSRVRARMC